MQIVSKDYAESHTAEEMANEPLGSGVFCMAEWKKGELIRLVPNEYSWLYEAGNKLPYVDEVLWYIVPDANSRTLMLEAGEVDIAIDPPYVELERLDAIEGLSAISVPLMGESTIWVNMRTPFSDPKVRQAANYAIDKESLIDIVLQGYGAPAYSFLYLGMYTNEEYGFPFDLDKAKELMAESEHPDGFEAELLVKAGDTVMEETGVVLKDQLAKIGIDVTITPLEAGTFFDRWFGSDFDMLYKLSTLDIYDSSENLNIDINDAGFTGWKDPDLWEFAQAASREPDPDKRAEMFDELQRRYMEAPPQLPLFHPLARWAQWDYVNGFQLMNTNLHPFYYTWITPH
jgi:peptide/nickel transport system substrate-binding protein